MNAFGRPIRLVCLKGTVAGPGWFDCSWLVSVSDNSQSLLDGRDHAGDSTDLSPLLHFEGLESSRFHFGVAFDFQKDCLAVGNNEQVRSAGGTELGDMEFEGASSWELVKRVLDVFSKVRFAQNCHPYRGANVIYMKKTRTGEKGELAWNRR